MNKVFALLILLCSVHVSCAQKIFLNKKSDLSVSAGINVPTGSKYKGLNPTLLANMKTGVLFDLSYLHNAWGILYLGGALTSNSFTKWSAEGSALYQGSTLHIQSLSAVITLKSRPGKTRVEWFASVRPGINLLNARTGFESSINGGYTAELLAVKSTRAGVSINAGLNYIASRNIAFTGKFGYQTITTDSKIYGESLFSWLSLSFGVTYRLNYYHDYRFSRI